MRLDAFGGRWRTPLIRRPRATGVYGPVESESRVVEGARLESVCTGDSRRFESLLAQVPRRLVHCAEARWPANAPHEWAMVSPRSRGAAKVGTDPANDSGWQPSTRPSRSPSQSFSGHSQTVDFQRFRRVLSELREGGDLLRPADIAKCYLNEPGADRVREVTYGGEASHRVSWPDSNLPLPQTARQRASRDAPRDGDGLDGVRRRSEERRVEVVWRDVGASGKGPSSLLDIPSTVFVISDALHLACARNMALTMYTNDRHCFGGCAILPLIGVTSSLTWLCFPRAPTGRSARRFEALKVGATSFLAQGAGPHPAALNASGLLQRRARSSARTPVSERSPLGRITIRLAGRANRP